MKKIKLIFILFVYQRKLLNNKHISGDQIWFLWSTANRCFSVLLSGNTKTKT